MNFVIEIKGEMFLMNIIRKWTYTHEIPPSRSRANKVECSTQGRVVKLSVLLSNVSIACSLYMWKKNNSQTPSTRISFSPYLKITCVVSSSGKKASIQFILIARHNRLYSRFEIRKVCEFN